MKSTVNDVKNQKGKWIHSEQAATYIPEYLFKTYTLININYVLNHTTSIE